MGYEVIKTIRGRRYRYEVESYRDSETGKVRNRWRYAGKAEGGPLPVPRRRADETRSALMGALEELLESATWQELTVASIAVHAGIAQATFYRYFHSRIDLLEACAARLVDEVDVRLEALTEIAEAPDVERRRFREWTSAFLSNPHGASVFFALWTTGVATAMRERRFERRRLAFSTYLRRLVERGFVAFDGEAVESLARALALLVQAFSYRTVIERRALAADESATVASMLERLVFA